MMDYISAFILKLVRTRSNLSAQFYLATTIDSILANQEKDKKIDEIYHGSSPSSCFE